ncbi:MAG TPA: HEAT repeat domain-containing protein [Deltaproteobacteria bacterium]|nr:HEAT repeat domain-containing protein [Deltaproteobacteria bacterium]
MRALPEIFIQLDAQKEHQAMALVISRLIGNLFSTNNEVRLRASTALNAIFDNLAQERRIKLLESLSVRLIEWIQEETLSTLPYKSICNHLKILIHNHIQTERFAEAIPILEVFSSINAGILAKNEKAYEISRDIIRELASKENLDVLFTAFGSTNPAKQSEAGSILVRLGDDAMNHMLDVLRDKKDSDERVRIMKLFIGTGKRAAPVVRDRITKPAPWYYLRNLAYILGHIGNEATAAALQPLLLNENKRLRLEALKSIYRTGGKERGPLLLDTLPQVEDSFKIDIIRTLGNAKSVEAAPELIKMLKKRKSVSAALREKLEETICTALGSIGSPEALVILDKISKSGFFSFRRYSNDVKIAAGLAAVSIRKKQENMPKEEKETEEPDQTQEETIEEIAGSLDDIDISK